MSPTWWPTSVNSHRSVLALSSLHETGMASASCLFMLRTIALWSRDLKIAGPLIAIHLRQWIIGLHNGFIAKEHWGNIEGQGNGCVFSGLAWKWMQLQFLYSEFFPTVSESVRCRQTEHASSLDIGSYLVWRFGLSFASRAGPTCGTCFSSKGSSTLSVSTFSTFVAFQILTTVL